MILSAAAFLALTACSAPGTSANGSAQSGGSTAAATPRVSPAGLDLLPLTIEGRGRTHRFTVEVARTSEQQAQGLMFRERLGLEEGMIFPFPQPRIASFWMRNTLIPLDMIFIRADGTIARVAANAVPRSEELVSSGEPVTAVLELRGGRAAELGIREGDSVRW